MGAAAIASALLGNAARRAAQEMPDSGGAHHDMQHDMQHDASPIRPQPRLGQIVFGTSASPAAHRAFIRGMLYLHNFHYPQAAAAFREAQTLDADDVMSYWGEAVSYTHPIWNQQDTAAARAALRRLAPTSAERLARARTPHERTWLATAEALYDDDVNKARRDTLFTASLKSPRRAYAIARRVFATHPNHPGAAHYVIHAVDDPAHAAMGLAAARAYSRIASDASHAQGRYTEASTWLDTMRAQTARLEKGGREKYDAELDSRSYLELEFRRCG